MSKKKGIGGLLGLATLVGAGAAVISYLYKYEKFSEAVDKDFTDVVDDAQETKEHAKRAYTSLRGSKEEFRSAARDLGYAARNLAIDTKNLAVDAGKDAYKTVREALDARSAKTADPDVEDEDFAEDEDVEVEFYEASEKGDDAAKEAVEDAREAAEEAGDTLKEASQQAREAVEKTAEAAQEKAADAVDTLKDAAEKASDQAQELKEKLGDAAEAAGEELKK